MPTEDDRTRWNQLYAGGSHASLQPDTFFLRAYEQFALPLIKSSERPLSALDIAGGVGRHALHLAQQGWQVTMNDLSDVAISQARSNAAHLNLALSFHLETALATLQRPNPCFDLIVDLFYLERTLFAPLASALNAGGLLFLKTRTEDHPRYGTGTDHPEYFLKRGELERAFPALETVHYSERDGLAELVARKSG